MNYQFLTSEVKSIRKSPGFHLKLTFMEGDADGYEDVFVYKETFEELIPYIEFLMAYNNIPWNFGRDEGILRRLPNSELFFDNFDLELENIDDYFDGLWTVESWGGDLTRLTSWEIHHFEENGIDYRILNDFKELKNND